MAMPTLHPDKMRAVRQVLDKKRQQKVKPPQPGLMQNLAAQAYASREAHRRRRVI